MEKEMTLEEMKSQFDGEWILEVIRGKVLYHAKDRDEVYRQVVALRPKRSAILYTGQMPEDIAIVL